MEILKQTERWSSFFDDAGGSQAVGERDGARRPEPAAVAAPWQSECALGDLWPSVDPAARASPLGLSLLHKYTHKQSSGDCAGFPDLQPGEFVITLGHGGTFTKLRQLSREQRPPATDKRRGTVKGFTSASQRNMLSVINSIDKSKIKGSYFVTHTQRHDPKVRVTEADWKLAERRRRAWIERLRRKYAGKRFFVLWKKEPHKTGHVHLHSLIFWLDEMPRFVDDFRPWNDRAWAEIVNPDAPDYDAPACRSEFMRGWHGVVFYCAKYCAKLDDCGGIRTGRIWGVEGRVHLEAAQSLEERAVSEDVGKRVKRVLRKLAEKRRTKWLVKAACGSWWTVRPGRVSENGFDPPVRKNLDQMLSWYRSIGAKLKLHKGRACRRRTREIWAYSPDDQCNIPVGVEHESFASSVHFVDTMQVSRLVNHFALQQHNGEDDIPF